MPKMENEEKACYDLSNRKINYYKHAHTHTHTLKTHQHMQDEEPLRQVATTQDTPNQIGGYDANIRKDKYAG